MEQKTKKTIKISILIVSLLIVIIGLTYAYFHKVLIGQKSYVLTSGDLKIYLDESKTLTSVVEETGAIPVTDSVGKQNEGYYFDLVNDTTEKINYEIYLDLNDENTMPIYALRYNLLQDENNLDITKNLSDVLLVDGQIRLYKGKLSGNQRHSYTLRVWLGLQAENDAKNKVFSGKIRIEAEQVVEYADNSGANVPELTSGMIPVTYNETDKTWVKADTTEKWYDYETQMWANAVTVTEDTRDSYMLMDAGEPISMDDINTMWVWIPRYEYQYTDLGDSYAGGTYEQPGEIKINFISNDAITPSDNTKYQIPEGFKFGDENIPGFWMGKFETSTLESCTAADNSINTACDLTTLTPQIKPGVTSWRGARVSTFFQASRLMQSSDDTLTYNADTYGFDVEGASLMDTHMLKNTEWGIVAMLSQSRYGKYGNSNYTGVNKEVYPNKSSNYITGMSNGTPSESSTTSPQLTYDTPDTGYGASTTGTIYGVYDMSGGAQEYVMGNYSNYSGSTSSNSGFCGTNGPTDGTCREWPNTKYVDVYTFDDSSSAYKFGDGTYETSGWYSDSTFFVTLYNPWFVRSVGVGVFSSDYSTGKSYMGKSVRFVIKP